jgi:hypothetical protein
MFIEMICIRMLNNRAERLTLDGASGDRRGNICSGFYIGIPEIISYQNEVKTILVRRPMARDMSH